MRHDHAPAQERRRTTPRHRDRTAIAVLALCMTAMATVGAAQIIRVNNPGGGGASHPVVKPTGPGPHQYCVQCQIPKGYSQTPGDKDELCVNKRVACMCSSPGNPPVKSDQPLCLYAVTPPVPGQPQNQPQRPLQLPSH
jgi:hypothetical protein